MLNVYVNDTLQPGVVVNLPQTGDGSGKSEWYNFVDCAPVSITLPSGKCQLRVESKSNSFGNLGTAAGTVGTNALTAVAEDQKKILLADVYKDSSLMTAFLNQISDAKLADLLRARVLGGTGGIGDLGDYGIPSAQTSDGLVGLRLQTKHCTAWPCSTLQACTWDPDLVKQIGKAVGGEAIEQNVDIWLAPGMNIHRDPLNGRIFEYYSEDPLSRQNGCGSD